MKGLSQVLIFFIFIIGFTYGLSTYGHLTEVEIAAKLKELMSSKNYKEAVEAADAAIAKNSKNFNFFHQRAIANLAQGKTGHVIYDLDQVISLKPDFEFAYSTRASILLKQGQFEKARSDYRKILEINPKNTEATQKIDLIGSLSSYANSINRLVKEQKFNEVIDVTSKILEFSPSYLEARISRAQSFEGLGEYDLAIAEYKRITVLKPDMTSAYLKAAELQFRIGQIDQTMEELKNCLHVDPENKGCFSLRKSAKETKTTFSKIEDLLSKKSWSAAIELSLQFLPKINPNAAPLIQKIYHFSCRAASNSKDSRTISFCSKAIELDQNDGQSYANRAEAYIIEEKYQEAVNDYSKALECEKGNREFIDGHRKAEGLLKQSQTVDYYKVLGVKRTASKEDIKRAYRALAKEWHPDKYKGEDQEKAQKKMSQINLANEILSDDELRRKYDAGEDPNNPQSGDGGFHGGFHGGFPGGFGGFGGGGGGFPGGFRFNFG